ncbi:acylphosphatase [Bacillus ectoiniformans]|uniref:acylphosphatase n=1 Tax=Bacillus ectoiniformans TaxID=1494429 RepID=UPI00195A16E5|nr:acylphosphatase [Bacillus ectoiniformans]MBM7647726.1 acylphosphatase [Bacillus ectoiniformans]
MKRLKIIAAGKVQGVAFRFFASNQANQWGLTGWVQNKPDGTVELEAQGEKDTLHQFLAFLENGPSPSSRTDELVHYEIDVKENEQRFSVRS